LLSYIGQHFDWRAQSACTSDDANLFYSEEPADQEAAKAICAGCKCRAECLATAMLREDSWGVWGGMTPMERTRHQNTWNRRMGGGASVRALRERTGIYADANFRQHQDRRYSARLSAAREARYKLSKTPADFPSRDEFMRILDMIISHPVDDGGALARRIGISMTWFNKRKRDAFLAVGVDEQEHYRATA